MTNTKPWKADYWTMIIEELKIENAKRKDTRFQWPYIYDYNQSFSKLLKSANLYDQQINRHHSYMYIDKPEIMEFIVKNWDRLNENQISRLRSSMRNFEKNYILKAVYKKRKEEFDALVAEINS
ncbi:MAG: hypothetical protein ACR2O9_01365 [Alphaproteobacteria bacterium]